MARLLEVNNLRVIFRTYRGIIKALNGVRLWLNEEERLGIVGETGCGKSVSALSIMRLIDAPGEIIEGQVLFEGTDLLKITEEEMDLSLIHISAIMGGTLFVAIVYSLVNLVVDIVYAALDPRMRV